MIKKWRVDFGVPDTHFYAIVQLSTWFTASEQLAEMRQEQVDSGKEYHLGTGFAWATNADYGDGGNIHPP